ncbi:MAG TPA: hypothetical protein VHU92_29095 [Streptosporangiaceae bacterium]|jgi:hypothetical protein|nr:hypothetical protein [Streptosporangiaceae bacterium]
MRRESSTVVGLVGEVDERFLARLAQSPNVSVARAPAADPESARPGWQAGAEAMREAARRRSTYVLVPDDPLADVAAAWRAMWDLSGGPGAAAEFEARAAELLAAWRDKRFELPDYYLVLAGAAAEGTGPDLYLGPLRAVRPRRVALAATPGSPAAASGPAARAASLLDTLRGLEHGPWWPPLDELIDVARRFYAGGLTETQLMPA